MKNLKLLITILGILFSLVSCSNKEKEIKKMTTDFFDAIKNENEDKLQSFYPSITDTSISKKDFSFDNIQKFDSVCVNKINRVNDSIYVVEVKGFQKGKINSEINVSLYINTIRDSMKIVNSKNMLDTGESIISFGKRTGCILKTDTTDIDILRKLPNTNDLALKLSLLLHFKLKALVTVTDWNWETGYSGSASGRGIVKNDSEYSLKNLKYKITYMDKSGYVITNDDDYISGKIPAYGSKSFRFYTSYVGRATTASIELLFDSSLIVNCVLEDESYTGKEYNEWFGEKKDEEGEILKEQ